MPQQDYIELEKQLRKVEEDYQKLHDEKEGLQARCRDLEEIAGISGNDINYLLAQYIYLHTPSNNGVIQINANGRTRKEEVNFQEWEKIVTRSLTETNKDLKKEVEELKRESAALRGVYFSSKMDGIMASNPLFNSVGFVYYDFANGKSLYTPGLLDLFGINEDEAKDKELSLMSFIHYLNRESRAGLVKALKDGVGLEDYKSHTRDGSKDLVLNAFPLDYNHRPVGVAVFLYDPKVGFDKRITYAFASRIRKAISKMSEKFEIIRTGSNKDNAIDLIGSPMFEPEVGDYVEPEEDK